MGVLEVVVESLTSQDPEVGFLMVATASSGAEWHNERVL